MTGKQLSLIIEAIENSSKSLDPLDSLTNEVKCLRWYQLIRMILAVLIVMKRNRNVMESL